MRANEYIRKYGLDKARELYNSDDWSTVSDVFLGNLKRLIESHELVGKVGGINEAKGEYFEIVHSGQYTELDPISLSKAITDVESCL